MSSFPIRLRELRLSRNLSQQKLSELIGTSKSSINMYERGEREPGIEMLETIADFFNVDMNYLLGKSDILRSPLISYIGTAPNVTDDVVTFPVIGEIAAGYDSIAVEDWTGETVDIPRAMLKGRKESEYFVLTVKGDSMYPHYQNNDKVLILKQSTLDHSGEVGAVLYEGECATLKKVEYKEGEDWLKLIPINPEFMPKLIEGSDLEQCRIIGKPTYLIRDLNNI